MKENDNLAEIGELETLDEDQAEEHSYELLTNPGNRFVIINNTLYTSATANLNYEMQQSWQVKINTSDNANLTWETSLSFAGEVTVYVKDVNEPPDYIGISGLSVSNKILLCLHNK